MGNAIGSDQLPPATHGHRPATTAHKRVVSCVSAPVFSQFGGAVTAGFTLVISHTNVGGTVFYTLDGSDPRVSGTGAVGPAAQAYSAPVPINAPTQIRARVSSSNQWSALVEAVFYPPQDLSKLVLTEIMYHAPNVGATNGDEFDFIELKNAGTNTLNLSGLAFTAGFAFTFTNGTTLAPGQFFLLARNTAAIAAKYPGVKVNGVFSGKLDNGGEAVTLSHPLGTTIFSVTYDNGLPWPSTADGLGFSLVPKNPGLTQAPDNGTSWRASTLPGGSPGADDPAPNLPPIVINEILTHTDPPQLDSLELFNPTGTNADVGGWYLTDDKAVPKKYHIPNATTISAGGYVFFTEAQFNAAPGTSNSFAFSSTGDDAYLFSADASGQLTGYSHGVAFGAAFNGVSFGRYLNSVGEEQFPLQKTRTLGLPNSGPRVGPVVINEIQYHPAPGNDEFVELLNITSTNVSLFDPAHPTNTWKFSGLGYTFPTNLVLAPGGMLLLVPTNPPDFRAKYGVPLGVQILGPYPGNLQDSGELLELQMPDTPNSNTVPYVTIEAVRYNDKAPWPPAADGSGPSIQRINALVYGNDPGNWMAAAATPGVFNPITDADGDGLPDAWEIAHGTDWTHPDANTDADGDGFSAWQEYLAGTDPLDPNSFLKLSGITSAGDVVTLKFLAASNHTYSVLYSPALSGMAWSKLADVSAQPTNGLVTVSDSISGSAARFYRLITPAQP